MSLPVILTDEELEDLKGIAQAYIDTYPETDPEDLDRYRKLIQKLAEAGVLVYLPKAH